MLAISPALDLHTPEKLERRRQIFGYAEVLKFTGLTRSLILEKRIYHTFQLPRYLDIVARFFEEEAQWVG